MVCLYILTSSSCQCTGPTLISAFDVWLSSLSSGALPLRDGFKVRVCAADVVHGVTALLEGLPAVSVGRCRLPLSHPSCKRPGSERSKLKCDDQISNSAFKFNLRRYTSSANDDGDDEEDSKEGGGGGGTAFWRAVKVRRCRVNRCNPR